MSAVGRQQPPQQCNTVDAGWETRDDPEANLGKLGATSQTSIQPICYTHMLDRIYHQWSYNAGILCFSLF